MIVATTEVAGAVERLAPLPEAVIAGEVSAATAWPQIDAEVSRWRIEAIDGPAVQLGVRVVLGGSDVTAYLTGEVAVHRALDETIATGSLQLVGPEWLPHQTTATWTRTPIEVYRRIGPAWGEWREEVWLIGVVVSCRPADRGVTLEFADAGYVFVKADACITLEPNHGLSLGGVCRQVATSAGIQATRIPDGPAAAKPVEARGEQVHRLLEALGKRAGWFWRTTAEGELEAYTATLAPPPAQPDHVWRLDQLDSEPSIGPPVDVPSRTVLRARSLVEVDESGLEIETTTEEIREFYAPKQAVFRQNGSTGARTPEAYTQQSLFRLTARTVEVLTKRGGQIVQRQTTQWAMYNPERGVYDVGNAPGAGPGPDGLFFVSTFIDEDGRGVLLFAEQLLPVAGETETFTYNDAGSLVGKILWRYGWRRRSRAIRSASSTTLDVAGALVDDGGDSWANEGNGNIERWGLVLREETAYEYGDAGAVVREKASTHSYYSARSTIESGGGGFVTSAGLGQANAQAIWQLTRIDDKTSTLDKSGRLAGEGLRTFAFVAQLRPAGSWDWGSEEYSNLSRERFVLARWETKRYHIESRGSYRLVAEVDGVRKEEIKDGKPPLPRYQASAWTQMVEQPIETELEDETVRRWFGFARRVVEDPWAESLDEIEQMVSRARQRELSFEIEISRPVAWATPGQSVRLISPAQGLDVRGLLVDCDEGVGTVIPTSTARYRIEVPI